MAPFGNPTFFFRIGILITWASSGPIALSGSVDHERQVGRRTLENEP